MEAAPPNAANMEPRNANDEPRKTGLLNLVNNRYTRVPTPAPKSAADWLMPLPTIAGTAMVAARIASSCWSAKTRTCPNGGRSFSL